MPDQASWEDRDVKEAIERAPTPSEKQTAKCNREKSTLSLDNACESLGIPVQALITICTSPLSEGEMHAGRKQVRTWMKNSLCSGTRSSTVFGSSYTNTGDDIQLPPLNVKDPAHIVFLDGSRSNGRKFSMHVVIPSLILDSPKLSAKMVSFLYICEWILMDIFKFVYPCTKGLV